MMKKRKTLHIVRHAKSSWDYESISDIDRPLKLKGIQNAYEMARRIKIRNTLPDLMITSPANRAIHTAIIFARVFEFPLDRIIIEENLYGAEEKSLMDMIKKTDNKLSSLMIFGHNPEFTNFANIFIKDTIDNISTAGIVSLVFDTDDWKDIGQKKLVSENFDDPKKDLQVESL
jgi:phosphohistidine phosphatase